MLQRVVAVKVVSAQYIPAYKAAIRMTSYFSHPNIIGLYDIVPIVEPEALYLVQEYVEGDDFATLLQAQLTPYEVADFGSQLCQALLYASSPSRKVCHGDLTPTTVLRDRQGLVRLNNFALPSDLYYFEDWSVIGDQGMAVSDKELPWGQLSPARHADDTRAVGLLLYQLLAGRPAGREGIERRSASSAQGPYVEPPIDGQLRFRFGTPAELCDTVARTLVRRHPQYIDTIETLYVALRTLTETLEPLAPVSAVPTSASSAYQPDQVLKPFTASVGGETGMEEMKGTGKLVSALPARRSGNTGLRLSAYRADGSGDAAMLEAAPEAAPTVADISLKLAAARQAAYPGMAAPATRSPIVWVLLLGLLVFGLFFAIGYFAGHLLFAH